MGFIHALQQSLKRKSLLATCNGVPAVPSWAKVEHLTGLDLLFGPGYYTSGSEPQNSPASPSVRNPGAQRLPLKKPRPSPLSLSSSLEPSTPSPPGDDQVVPSFQRLSVYEHTPPHTPPRTPSRSSRPLPPIPSPVELVTDRAMDDDLFSGVHESHRLMPEPCPKPPTLCPGTPVRRSFRGCGQVNHAYLEGPGGARVQTQNREEQRESQLLPQPQGPAKPQSCDRAHRRLRRSHSGPALRQSCPRHTNPTLDKPQVPPRIPIPPRTPKTTESPRRWSAEVSSGGYSDEDKPPKVPPREPLSPYPRTPSPKSLPTYLNGIMPPTQSFAPDPKYVSRKLQRQHSEGSPCILPIMEQGRKASQTHYFLLPQRPAYLDRLERFLRGAEYEPGCQGASGSDWASRPHTDLV
ncbi:hypothetical protein JZ751_017507 [Albula glossodonta]|uniref:ERBB receptor feedback inhibitor 1 n=1 Tax=Albula glossodonta TaxID=121402 RepID=A0A8T2PMD3_9TELE|nr:hypothetical protein JZ751_017507 [Albula glossodonta]